MTRKISEFGEYMKEMVRHYEEEAEESKLGDLLVKVSLAEIYFEEGFPKVWIGGEEAPELGEALEEGAEVEEILDKIKTKYPHENLVWIREDDEDGTAYYLMPRFLAFSGDTQYIIQQCERCGSQLGTARICDSTEPWNCRHSTVIYCANCGAESGWVGPVHGGQGVELNEEEVDLLVKFFHPKEDDEQ